MPRTFFAWAIEIVMNQLSKTWVKQLPFLKTQWLKPLPCCLRPSRYPAQNPAHQFKYFSQFGTQALAVHDQWVMLKVNSKYCKIAYCTTAWHNVMSSKFYLTSHILPWRWSIFYLLRTTKVDISWFFDLMPNTIRHRCCIARLVAWGLTFLNLKAYCDFDSGWWKDEAQHWCWCL